MDINSIKLNDFDLIGMFELNDNTNIEDLVTDAGNGKYISRSSNYWKQYTCSEASSFRERLKSMIPFLSGKKLFVLLDYMANLSGKVYYEQVSRCINRPDVVNTQFHQAKKCLFEDISNIVDLFNGRIIKQYQTELPRGNELIPARNIECNNMALLYIFTKNFDMPKDYSILNTGLGGIFIGPFFQKFYGTKWTNMLKSKYVVDKTPIAKRSIIENIVEPEIFSNGNILLLDDNVGTGGTINEIKIGLQNYGFHIKTGAVQYNWINYYRVGIGEKDISRFNPSEINYVTQYNYPGHKFLDHAIAILCGSRNLDGEITSINPPTGEPYGEIYKQYKTKKHYEIQNITDLITLQEKGLRYASLAGIDYYLPGKNNSIVPNQIFTKESQELMKRIDEYNKYLYSNMPGLANNKGQPGDN